MIVQNISTEFRWLAFFATTNRTKQENIKLFDSVARIFVKIAKGCSIEVTSAWSVFARNIESCDGVVLLIFPTVL